MFWSVGWPLLWAAGFFCNLDIVYGGLGIGKLQFLIKKKFNFFQLLFFFEFLVIKALDPDWTRIRIRIGLQPQPLDPDPEKMNTDPKHWYEGQFRYPLYWYRSYLPAHNLRNPWYRTWFYAYGEKGVTVIGINIVTSLSKSLASHNSRTKEFISLA